VRDRTLENLPNRLLAHYGLVIRFLMATILASKRVTTLLTNRFEGKLDAVEANKRPPFR
jgi:hypothetical protein